MRSKEVKCTVVNFWNELRVKNKVTMKALATTLGVSQGTIGNWFTGRQIPSRAHTKELCDWFGVDEDLGYSEFVKSHSQWETEHLGISKSENSATVSTSAEDIAPISQVVAAVADPNFEIFKMLYGKISFEWYEHLRSLSFNNENILEYLYGKIEFDKYIEIVHLVKGV